jgi:16S rRNA (guanine527-N7)-methyltransferase
MEIGSAEWQQLIIDAAQSFEINIDPSKAEQFAVHAAELMKWNRKINLTAITSPKDVALKHFMDSVIPSLLIAPDAKILDIGSGGGFPGIPLKVLMPSLSVMLIDASRKKISFLKHIIRTLKLENIEAHHERAEELAEKQAVTNSFDVIISRALASIENLVLMAAPLLAKDGVIIAMKGAEPIQEIKPARKQVDKNYVFLEIGNNWYSLYLKKYTLPYQKSQRSIIVINSGGLL